MKGLSQLVGRRDWMSDVRMKLLVGPMLILMILGTKTKLIARFKKNEHQYKHPGAKPADR